MLILTLKLVGLLCISLCVSSVWVNVLLCRLKGTVVVSVMRTVLVVTAVTVLLLCGWTLTVSWLLGLGSVFMTWVVCALNLLCLCSCVKILVEVGVT